MGVRAGSKSQGGCLRGEEEGRPAEGRRVCMELEHTPLLRLDCTR